MDHSELKPKLDLVATERVRFHEHPQRRRTLRLVEKIRQDAFLRNPPIVAGLGAGDYLLLDGANRVSAMKELGYSHIPAQIVDYGDPAIQLKVWHHALIQGRSLNLLETFRAMPELRVDPVSTGKLGRYLELRRVYAIFVDESADCWGLFPSTGVHSVDSFDRIAVMGRIVASYEGQSDLERIKLADFSALPDVLRSLEHQLCLFPGLTKEELMDLARAKVMIPTGITRHLIPGRALGLNIDLGFLTENTSEEAKQKHFRAHLDQLEMDGRIRFYEESVFVMNE